MLKKYFIFLLAIFSLAVFMVGCSASKPEERKGEISEVKPAVETKPAVEPKAAETKEPVQPVVVKEPETPSKVETPAPEKQAQTETVKSVSYTVQLGAFKEIADVEKFEKIIKSKFTLPIKTEPDTKTGTYKVTVGKFDTKEDAYKVRDYCVQQGYKDAWVTEYNK